MKPPVASFLGRTFLNSTSPCAPGLWRFFNQQKWYQLIRPHPWMAWMAVRVEIGVSVGCSGK